VADGRAGAGQISSPRAKRGDAAVHGPVPTSFIQGCVWQRPTRSDSTTSLP
jgi:hypothetical protein